MIANIFSYIKENSTPISIAIMVIIVSIVILLIIRSILKHLDTHDLKLKVGNIELNDTEENNIKTSTYQGKDRRYAKDYYKEKIHGLIIQNKKIRQLLRNKQYDIAYASLKAIEILCLNIFEEVLIEYCNFKKIKLDNKEINEIGNISYTRPYLVYEKIIRSITHDNLKKALRQINKNGIHSLKYEKWERYKRGKIQHYHSEAEQTFKKFYTVEGCTVPVKWVKEKCMDPLGEKIKNILLKTQDDLREEAIKAHTRIKSNNKKIDDYFSKI